MRHLGRILGQRFIVECARGVGVQTQVELVFPAELEARLAQSASSRERAPGWPLATSAACAAIL